MNLSAYEIRDLFFVGILTRDEAREKLGIEIPKNNDGLAQDFERLDLFQAYEALRQGKCVRPVRIGCIHKYQKSDNKFYCWDDTGRKSTTSGFYTDPAMTFRIVDEPTQA